jgi:putative pyoverdin transport system ATP-binding/permease protein
MKIFPLFIKSSLFVFILSIITGVLSGLCMTGMIYVIHQAIDSHMENTSRLVYEFLFVWLGYGVTSYLSVTTMTRMSEEVIMELRKIMSQKVLQASFQSMEMEKNRLFTILTSDIGAISNGFNRMPNVVTAAAMIVGCVAYMGFISVQLLLMFIVLIVVALLFFKLPMQAYNERMRDSRAIETRLFSYFEGIINGLKELSLSKKLRHSFKEDLLYPACEAQKDHNIKGSVRLAFISKWGEMLLLLGLALMLVVIDRFGVSTFEDFAKFLTVALFLIPALQRVSGFLPVLGKMNVSLEQIDQVGLSLDKSAEINKNTDPIVPVVDQPLISLKEVTFSYFHEEEKKFFQLGPINLDIKQGEIVYLIGGNGSGKSTLAKVLCGLYAPETGHVEYAGNTITSNNIDEYREYYSAIFFDFYLFEQLNHIKSDFWKEKAQEYLVMLELDKKVKIEGDKLSTTSLSTGQRKRLALLMSLLEDKPIYLFDEWAASQDPYYKNVFYNKILPDLKALGKTLFIITHDEQYFDCADRILLLQSGKLVKEDLPKDIISFYIREKA